MNRWGVRILGIVMLLVFALIFFNLYSQLEQMRRIQSQPSATQTR